MDSGTSVNSSSKAGASKGNRRDLNSSGKDANENGSGSGSSGVTSPRVEATELNASNSASKRRPSITVINAGPRPSSNSSNRSAPPSSEPSKNVSLFAHLPQVSANTCSPVASITAQLLKSGKEAVIHPAIIKLGLAFADYSVMGAAERCRQMLLAFKQV